MTTPVTFLSTIFFSFKGIFIFEWSQHFHDFVHAWILIWSSLACTRVGSWLEGHHCFVFFLQSRNFRFHILVFCNAISQPRRKRCLHHFLVHVVCEVSSNHSNQQNHHKCRKANDSIHLYFVENLNLCSWKTASSHSFSFAELKDAFWSDPHVGSQTLVFFPQFFNFSFDVSVCGSRSLHQISMLFFHPFVVHIVCETSNNEQNQHHHRKAIQWMHLYFMWIWICVHEKQHHSMFFHQTNIKKDSVMCKFQEETTLIFTTFTTRPGLARCSDAQPLCNSHILVQQLTQNIQQKAPLQPQLGERILLAIQNDLLWNQVRKAPLWGFFCFKNGPRVLFFFVLTKRKIWTTITNLNPKRHSFITIEIHSYSQEYWCVRVELSCMFSSTQ